MLVVKNLSDNAGDIRSTGSIPGSGRSPGGGQGDPLLDRIPRTEKSGGLQSLGLQSSWTQLKQLSIHTRKDIVGLPEHSYFLEHCYLFSAFEISSSLNGKCGFSRSSAPVLWEHPEQDMEMGWGGPSLDLVLLGSPVLTYTLHCPRRLHSHNTSSKINDQGTSLEVQWLRLCLPMQGVKVQSLVGKLRSHMPWGQKKKTKDKP